MAWTSERFGRVVHLTRHARDRMRERQMSQHELAALIEGGEVKRKDARRLWIFAHVPARDDNLVCVAAVLEDQLIVKTVMTHWQDNDR